jgi:hypothetical protein
MKMSQDLLNPIYETDYDISYDIIYDDIPVKIPTRSSDYGKNPDKQNPDKETQDLPETSCVSETRECVYGFYLHSRYFFIFLSLVIAGLIGILFVIVTIRSTTN